MVLFPYGDDRIDIVCDCKHIVAEMKEIAACNENELLAEAISNPIDGEDLAGFFASHKRLLVIVPDATRAAPSTKLLDHIIRESGNNKLTFIVATGSHRPPTEKELEKIFGRHFAACRDNVMVHDSRYEKNMARFGTTSRGTEVFFNKAIEKSDGIITLGNVKPHYFAGFAGGRKSFLPGIAAYKTIEANHSHAVSTLASPMVLAGNPVHEDMAEAAAMIDKDVFSIQTVMAPDRKVCAAFTGGLTGTFDSAAKYSREIYSSVLREKGNIVVTANPHPMDINLYQSQHAIENGRLALEDGGILILISKCWGGVGNDAFLKAFDKVNNYDDVEHILKDGYRLGFHKVSRMMKMLEDVQLWAVTGLDPDIVMRAKMRSFSDVQTAVDAAINSMKDVGNEPKVILMPGGGLTVPLIGE